MEHGATRKINANGAHTVEDANAAHRALCRAGDELSRALSYLSRHGAARRMAVISTAIAAVERERDVISAEIDKLRPQETGPVRRHREEDP